MKPSASRAPHSACPSSERLSQSSPPHSAHMHEPAPDRRAHVVEERTVGRELLARTPRGSRRRRTRRRPRREARRRTRIEWDELGAGLHEELEIVRVREAERGPAGDGDAGAARRPGGRGFSGRETRRRPGQRRDRFEVARCVDGVGQPFERFLHRLPLLDDRHKPEVPVRQASSSARASTPSTGMPIGSSASRSIDSCAGLPTRFSTTPVMRTAGSNVA